MSETARNPSRKRHNPSRTRDGFGCREGETGAEKGRSVESVMNPSRLPVTDSEGRKSSNNRKKLSLFPYIRQSVTPTPARGACTCEGGYGVFVTDSRFLPGTEAPGRQREQSTCQTELHSLSGFSVTTLNRKETQV